jgi:hypothetical protein
MKLQWRVMKLQRHGNEAPMEGNETPMEGNETPMEGNEAPMEGNEAPIEMTSTPAAGRNHQAGEASGGLSTTRGSTRIAEGNAPETCVIIPTKQPKHI